MHLPMARCTSECLVEWTIWSSYHLKCVCVWLSSVIIRLWLRVKSIPYILYLHLLGSSNSLTSSLHSNSKGCFLQIRSSKSRSNSIFSFYFRVVQPPPQNKHIHDTDMKCPINKNPFYPSSEGSHVSPLHDDSPLKTTKNDTFDTTLGCPRKLGSKVRISGLYPQFMPHL